MILIISQFNINITLFTYVLSWLTGTIESKKQYFGPKLDTCMSNILHAGYYIGGY